MDIKPLHDRLVVRRMDSESTTAGGLYIPDSAQERPLKGEVIAVGTGKRLEDGTVTALDVKVGDKILFGKYFGTEIKLDGEEHLILREDEVLGIIE